MQGNFMARMVSFLCLLTIVACVGLCNLYQPRHHVPKLFSDDGQPHEVLCELLRQDGIVHDNSLATIVQETQKKWLRPAGFERFQVQDTHAQRREKLVPLFTKIGLTAECYPFQKSYDYCLVLGATIASVRVRLAYVAKLWNDGITFKNLVLLTGARTLDLGLEAVSVLCDMKQQVLPIRSDWRWDEHNAPTTEAGMMRLVYDQAQLPNSLRNVPLTIIDTPKQVGPNGALCRPITVDTLAHWIATKPTPGSCLVISSQPFVGYQDTVVRTVVPESSFQIETVGPSEAVDCKSILICLDSLARWLYQEQIRLGKKQNV